MFRRVCSAKASPALFALSSTVRMAHHKPTTHDWSQIFSRELTEEDLRTVEQQMNRTVSAVVPGEMFMRHWIAAEQSTVSVVNRVISGIIAVCTMIWAAGYATLGYNGHNSAHTAGWIFIAYWFVLHTHIMWLAPLFITLGALELVLN